MPLNLNGDIAMTEMKPHLKLIVIGIVLVLAIISASYLWLNITQPPPTCTINQTPGKALVIDQSLNNAVICTKIGDSVALNLGLWERVGGKWYITNSSGLQVSDGVLNMPVYPGIGTEDWMVTMITPGVQKLTAKCRQFGTEGRVIDSQNLTFIVS